MGQAARVLDQLPAVNPRQVLIQQQQIVTRAAGNLLQGDTAVRTGLDLPALPIEDFLDGSGYGGVVLHVQDS